MIAKSYKQSYKKNILKVHCIVSQTIGSHEFSSVVDLITDHSENDHIDDDLIQR